MQPGEGLGIRGMGEDQLSRKKKNRSIVSRRGIMVVWRKS
jgi:hypothetical protein